MQLSKITNFDACCRGGLAGGGDRVRTDDLLRARQPLSQLSYAPVTSDVVSSGGDRKT